MSLSTPAHVIPGDIVVVEPNDWLINHHEGIVLLVIEQISGNHYVMRANGEIDYVSLVEPGSDVFQGVPVYRVLETS